MIRNHESPQRIAVIGGGIAGLAAARRVLELEPQSDLILLEASHRLGGALWTECRDGWILEHGADNFITSVPWAIDLCRRIGCADELLETNQAHRGALVVDPVQDTEPGVDLVVIDVAAPQVPEPRRVVELVSPVEHPAIVEADEVTRLERVPDLEPGIGRQSREPPHGPVGTGHVGLVHVGEGSDRVERPDRQRRA